MRREWTIWLGFIAVVLLAALFVVSRDDDEPGDGSQLSAGTSLPTTTSAPPTTATTVPPTTTSSSSTTTTSTSTTPSTTRRVTPVTSQDTVPPTSPPTVPITAAPTTAPPTTQAPQLVQFGPGTYRINIDLPAGTYHTEGIGPDCYWARLSSVTPTPTAENVIASGRTFGGPATVGIPPSDAAFYTSGCDVWRTVV